MLCNKSTMQTPSAALTQDQKVTSQHQQVQSSSVLGLLGGAGILCTGNSSEYVGLRDWAPTERELTGVMMSGSAWVDGGDEDTFAGR